MRRRTTAASRTAAHLRNAVGIKAIGRYTLRIQLVSPQPWFVQQLSHTSFIPVHRATVQKHGKNWTDLGNIVTNGPFRLSSWRHDASVTLVKNTKWRNAKSVKLTRVELPIIVDGATADERLPGGERRRLDDRHPTRRHPEMEEDQVLQGLERDQDVLLRVQREEHLRREPASRDGLRDGPLPDHQVHHPGRANSVAWFTPGRHFRRADDPEERDDARQGQQDQGAAVHEQGPQPERAVSCS